MSCCGAHPFAAHKIEQQHCEMERSLTRQVDMLRPQSRLRLTQAGLEVVIRYPLDLADAAKVDDQITRKLLDALEQTPKLKLVGSGTPNIQPVTDGSEPAERLSVPEKAGGVYLRSRGLS